MNGFFYLKNYNIKYIWIEFWGLVVNTQKSHCVNSIYEKFVH